MPFPPGTPLQPSEACPPGADQPLEGPDEAGTTPDVDPGTNEPGFP